VLVGAPGENEGGEGTGAAYVFQRAADGSWDKGFRLRPPELQPGCRFGTSVAISGDVAAVSAPYLCGEPGRVYVFQRTGPGNVWDVAGARVLRAPEPLQGDDFGHDIALSGDVLAIAQPSRADPRGGARFTGGPVFVYTRAGTGDTWEGPTRLEPPGGYSRDEFFGGSVGASPTHLIVGADDESSIFKPTAVYIFARAGGTGPWTDVVRIASPDTRWDDFGDKVAIAGDLAVVGAPARDGHSGRAYVIERTGPGNSWGPPQLVLPPPDDLQAMPGWGVGGAVATDGRRVVIGSPRGRTARLIEKSATGWDLHTPLWPSTREFDQSFGDSVALSDTLVVVGDSYSRLRDINSGMVYVR
jgi:hypothetical protein